MKNVRITLDEATAAWARVEAAQQGKSLSRMLGDILHERMRGSEAYEKAMPEWFAYEPRILSVKGSKYPKREELYDRMVFVDTNAPQPELKEALIKVRGRDGGSPLLAWSSYHPDFVPTRST